MWRKSDAVVFIQAVVSLDRPKGGEALAKTGERKVYTAWTGGKGVEIVPPNKAIIVRDPEGGA